MISGVLNSKITQMTLQRDWGLVGHPDRAERARTVENACEGPDPAVDIKLLDGVSILSGIYVAGLEVHAIRRVARTDREGLRLCSELELPCKLSFCQDIIRTGPGAIFWTHPRTRDFNIVGDVLNGGESLYHGREGGETAKVGSLAWF